MKKYALLLVVLMFNTFLSFSQTAVDFTANDCNGVSHHLFAELDAGKVIVVAFIDPCSGCIAPSFSAQSIVQEFAVTNPGRVLFYVSDDQGNSPCTTITSWAVYNGMGSATTFADSTFRLADYGKPSMPKIVVMGGTSHHVFTIQDDVVDTTVLKTAISDALARVSVPQTSNEGFNISLFPNPAKDKLLLSYTLH